MGSIAPVRRWRAYRDGHRALLDRDDWCAWARTALADGHQAIVRLAETTTDRSCGRGPAQPVT
ncbi:hypothetical protein AB0J81_28925 [Streptomyces bobili]|uniref:hypothetical protein n=1 Tax=Streptomyces bobili TaxID=67280 RepID=UPI003431703E